MGALFQWRSAWKTPRETSPFRKKKTEGSTGESALPILSILSSGIRDRRQRERERETGEEAGNSWPRTRGRRGGQSQPRSPHPCRRPPSPPPASTRPSAGKRVTRNQPPAAKSIDQWPLGRVRDGRRAGRICAQLTTPRCLPPAPPSGVARPTAHRGAVSSADTCEQQFSRIIPVA